MFMKGIIRGRFSINLFFRKRVLIISHGHDLSIPLACESSKDLEHYNLMAEKNDLCLYDNKPSVSKSIALDLKAKLIIKVPLLETTDSAHIDSFFKKVKYTEEMDSYYVELSKEYPNAVLDIFPHLLKRESDEIKYLDTDYFKLANEGKYLNFICEVFKENDECCYIEYNFSNINYLSRTIDTLDIIDKTIFMKQVIHHSNEKKDKYIIRDINLLTMFAKEMLRENPMIDLYFFKRPIIIFFGYDLSIPLACESDKDLEYYKKIANKNDLFFR